MRSLMLKLKLEVCTYRWERSAEFSGTGCVFLCFPWPFLEKGLSHTCGVTEKEVSGCWAL